MIDAVALEVHVGKIGLDVIGQHAGGALHAVTKADGANAHLGQPPAIDGHGIGVVEDESPWAEAVHGLGYLLQRAEAAQAAEDAAGVERVANAKIDPVFQRNILVDLVGVQPADLEGDDDVLRAFQRGVELRGGLDLGRKIVGLDQLADEPLGALQPRGIDVIEAEGAALQCGKAENVDGEGDRESDAAGADDDDFRMGHGRTGIKPPPGRGNRRIVRTDIAF